MQGKFGFTKCHRLGISRQHGLVILVQNTFRIGKEWGVIGRLVDAAVVGVASGLVEDATVALGLALVHVALPVEITECCAGTGRGTIVEKEDSGEARGGGACTGDG